MKKMIYLLLSLIMAANANDARAWEYPTSDPGIIAGTGTESNPIKINSAQALADLSYWVNAGETFEGKFFVLTDDIVLNDNLISANGNPVSGSKQWTPIGFSYYFSGTFDGQGHTIRGMYIDDDATHDEVGLFGYTYNATIKNLKLADCYVRGSNTYMGGIVGYASGTHLQQNCSYQGKMMTRTNDYVGTMVAYCASTTTIEGCHFEGMIDWEVGASGTKNIGGLLGYGQYATVKNCTVNADIKDVIRSDGQTLHMGGG